LRNFIKKS